MSTMLQQNERDALTIAPAVAPTCDTCGETSPDGRCLNVGACSNADAIATRHGQHGNGGKYAVPASWNAVGRVD